MEIDAEQFIGVKGFKAKGKRISTWKIDTIEEMESKRVAEPEPYTDEDENGMNGDNPDTNSTADGNGDGNEKERSRQQILDEITGQLNLFPDDEE